MPSRKNVFLPLPPIAQVLQQRNTGEKNPTNLKADKNEA